MYENIDNINEVYIYLNDEFICSATNRDLGVDAMTLEEHKKAVKAYKANNAAYRDWETDRKSTRLNSSHRSLSRMPSSA